MLPSVTVVDYGMGNLLSVVRAFEHCGARVLLTSSPADISAASYLVLPGVGAFADGMSGLRKLQLIKPIRNYAESGRPFLGICLGMQMMLDSSEEFGVHEGLGLISGRVVPIPPVGLDEIPHRIPHVGWNGLVKPAVKSDWNNSILSGVREGTSVYFVHSFAAYQVSEDNRLADTLYDGVRISAAIRSGKLYGCQFHPEKSGPAGLGIIAEFLDLHIQDDLECDKMVVNGGW